MTPTGIICTLLIMAAALAGLILCGGKKRSAVRTVPRRDSAGELPTVAGEPVVFRQAELRFVTCRASMDTGDEAVKARAFSPYVPEQRAAAKRYFRKELSYVLADLILEAGGVCFERDGETLRAEIRAVLMPERMERNA